MDRLKTASHSLKLAQREFPKFSSKSLASKRIAQIGKCSLTQLRLAHQRQSPAAFTGNLPPGGLPVQITSFLFIVVILHLPIPPTIITHTISATLRVQKAAARLIPRPNNSIIAHSHNLSTSFAQKPKRGTIARNLLSQTQSLPTYLVTSPIPRQISQPFVHYIFNTTPATSYRTSPILNYITPPLPIARFTNTATIASSLFAPFRVISRTFFTSRPALSPAIMSAAKTKAQKIIDENGVVVFSKSYCPYCRATKTLLNEKHAKYFLLELDEVGMY